MHYHIIVKIDQLSGRVVGLFFAHGHLKEICHCMAHRWRTSREDESSLLDCKGKELKAGMIEAVNLCKQFERSTKRGKR